MANIEVESREVDRYLTSVLGLGDPTMEKVLAENERAGLPQIDVSAPMGKFLMLLVQICGARSVLEVGTLGGYSTTWLARGVPQDGQVVSVELEQEHARVARANVAAAGVGEKVQVLVGPAASVLPTLHGHPALPFGLLFLDADKKGNPEYLRLALPLLAPGALVVVDNVVRQGAILDESSTAPDVLGTQEVLKIIAEEPRLEGTAVQTVGSKGWDGFALARFLG